MIDYNDGGKNFGIVTGFDLQTYPQGKGPAWGGQNCEETFVITPGLDIVVASFFNIS